MLNRWRPLGIVTGSTLASSLMTLAATLAAARFLDKVEFGRFIFLIAVSTLVAALCDIGVTSRMITEYNSSEGTWSEPPLEAFWSAQVWSYTVGAIAIAGVGSIPFVADRFHMSADVIVLGAFNGAVIGIFNFLTAVLQATKRWSARAQVVLLQGGLRTVGTLVGLALGIATAAGLGAAVGATAGLLFTLRHRDLARLVIGPRAVRGITAVLPLWRGSSWFAAASVIAALAAYAPIAAVSWVGGPVSLAVFGLAYQLAAGPGLLLSSIMTFLLPSGADRMLPVAEYRTLVRRTISPALILLLLGAGAAPFIVAPIFGEGFARAILPFELLVAATGIFVVANPIQFLHYRATGARAIAIMDSVLLISIVASFLVLLRWVAVPTAAAAGVLIAATLSRAVGSAMLSRRLPDLIATSRP